MLEIKNITSGYNNKIVIDSLSETFEKGKLISIIGINGSGKSTFLKTISGILRLSKGDIYIDSNNIKSLNRNDIAKKITYLSQEKIIPDMTVEQMVILGRYPHLSFPKKYSLKDIEIAKNAMKEVGILEYTLSPLNTLSGGMRQNAYIAMALAQDTDYILLDEPTTFLDIHHQIELMQKLKKLSNSGKGIIMVMHDLSLALEFSDEIAILHNGKIVKKDFPKNILKGSEIEDIFGVKIKYLENESKYIITY